MYFARYKNSRFWGVYDASDTLICVCVYKKGAQEVLQRMEPTQRKEENDATVSVSLGNDPC